MSDVNSIKDISLEEVMDDRFSRYAKYIILDRALPDVRDGLKPVQRRIIYAMHEQGNHFDKPYRKSAKTVGIVIGNYHPHGDSSVYEAMVRLSQPWKNNQILVDMQGNNGSIDDDPAAAMRYTEARLSQYAQMMMEGIKEDTVSFVPNFDDSDHEPTVLPTLIPHLLVNGSTGIAAGYATNIPPFNLHEVIDAIIATLRQPDISIEALSYIMPAPDFPTGGDLLEHENMLSVYETGKGKITLRARFEVIEKKSMKQLVITQIPYEVIKSNLVKRIDDLMVNKTLDAMIDVRDESDRHGLRIVIDCKADADIELVKNVLFKHTEAQIVYNINMVAILNRAPMQCSIKMILEGMISHYQEVLTRLATYRVNKLNARVHIITGLIKAISIVDEVIAIIRQSKNKEDAKLNLVHAYDFSLDQAEAIVSLRLYRLTNTDIVALKEEFALALNEIEHYEGLLSSTTLLNHEIIRRLEVIKSLFPSPRRSLLSTQDAKVVIDKVKMVQNERVVLSMTRDGYIKKVSLRSANASSEAGIKSKDVWIGENEVDSLDHVLFILSDGYYGIIPIYELKESKYKDSGDHFSAYVKHDAKVQVIKALVVKSFDAPYTILTASSSGIIKQTFLKDFELTRLSRTSQCMVMSKQDSLISVNVIDRPKNIACISALGYVATYPTSDIPIVATKAKGVKAMNLGAEDEMIGAEVVDHDYLILMNQHDGVKRIKISDVRLGKRPFKGDLTFKKVKSNPTTLKWALNVASTSSFKVMNDDVVVEHWAKDIAIKTLDSTFSSANGLDSKGHLVKSFVHTEALDPLVSHFEVESTEPAPHFENISFDIK
jgi:topoisomerase IV subunit A